MVNASFINRLSQAVDLIEQRSQQSRPLKIVKVRRGFREDGNVARARHFAAHPADRDANIVLFNFCDDDAAVIQRALIIVARARRRLTGKANRRRDKTAG